MCLVKSSLSATVRPGAAGPALSAPALAGGAGAALPVLGVMAAPGRAGHRSFGTLGAVAFTTVGLLVAALPMPAALHGVRRAWRRDAAGRRAALRREILAAHPASDAELWSRVRFGPSPPTARPLLRPGARAGAG